MNQLLANTSPATSATGSGTSRAGRALPALLLAGALVTLAGCGMARSAPHGNMHEGMHGTMPENMQSRYDPARMQAMMNQRLTELKSRLNLTSAQETAWNTFTAALQPVPATAAGTTGGMGSGMGAGMAGMGDRASMASRYEELSKLPTPERLERMRAMHAQHMAEMNARMSQHTEAVKNFYAVLNPEQQKTFDAEFTRAMGHARGHMMGGKSSEGRGRDGHAEHREHRS